MEIHNGKFLVPQANVCYRFNPDEVKLIKPILDKYNRRSKIIDEIEERFKTNGGKKVRVSLDITVPCYLELEETLKAYRALPENRASNIIKRHKYLTYGMRDTVNEWCAKNDLSKVSISLKNDKEIVYATGKNGELLACEVREFIDTFIKGGN